MSPGLQRKLLRRIAELKRVCAESYQVIGSLASDCGRFGDPDIDKALDNLAQMRPVHDDVLPFDSKPRATWVVPVEFIDGRQA